MSFCKPMLHLDLVESSSTNSRKIQRTVSKLSSLYKDNLLDVKWHKRALFKKIQGMFKKGLQFDTFWTRKKFLSLLKVTFSLFLPTHGYSGAVSNPRTLSWSLFTFFPVSFIMFCMGSNLSVWLIIRRLNFQLSTFLYCLSTLQKSLIRSAVTKLQETNKINDFLEVVSRHKASSCIPVNWRMHLFSQVFHL